LTADAANPAAVNEIFPPELTGIAVRPPRFPDRPGKWL